MSPPTNERVYLDYAATAPLKAEVLEAMLPWMGLVDGGGFGNASALTAEGKQARQALEAARATVASSIGAIPPEIVFTSGGTESNNALITGLCHGLRNQQGIAKGGNLVVCSAFEHQAVLEPVRSLRRDGWLTDQVAPTRQGLIEPVALAEAIDAYAGQAGCSLVSVMAANNEVGTLQPLAELAGVAHSRQALFHSDAVQALGKVPLDVQALGLDAASFSAHKIGGPKGVGAFFLKSLTPFKPQLLGGGQERGLRSGTANVAGAVGMAKALELAVAGLAEEASRLAKLRDWLAAALCQASPRVSLTVDDTHTPRLPNLLSVLVEGSDSQSLVLGLDSAGFAVSGGSACSTGSLDPSHVLLAMSVGRSRALSVLRISFGHATTNAHLEAFVAALASLL